MKSTQGRTLAALLLIAVLGMVAWLTVASPDVEAGSSQVIRVLFVGGDWKAQLTRYHGTTPLRGHFVQQVVDQAAPRRFAFTQWTSYEFLQYADIPTLSQFDVIVCGDIMGQSVLPRTVEAVRHFVTHGGGFWYCDNHKAFMFDSRELSFDDILPVEVVPFDRYTSNGHQGWVGATPQQPLKLSLVAAHHPIVSGLNWSTVPELGGAHWGKPKPGATVIASGPQHEPLWVAGTAGQGRSFWSGGVFANDELSEKFSTWPDIGRFYVQTLTWLAGPGRVPAPTLGSKTATGTLTVDSVVSGPAISSRHFGIHGQEAGPGGPMTGADLALYQALQLDGTFARPSSFAGIRHKPGGAQYEWLSDTADLKHFDWSLYNFSTADQTATDLKRIHAEPVFLFWCPWHFIDRPLDATQYAKYFAATAEYMRKHYPGMLHFFEICNEPDLRPQETELPRFAQFFTRIVTLLHPLYPELSFGAGGMGEGRTTLAFIQQLSPHLDWLSRHPYGFTGESVFYWQDRYQEQARKSGRPDLKFIVSEWDFWLYGVPAFDYLMMRVKPLVDRADTCLGTLQYRWREYEEGGYVFGLHGEFDKPYGELPVEWPNPGHDKPITYRYNAFWLVRQLRGPQLRVHMNVPALAGRVADDPQEYTRRWSDPAALSTHAYAVATFDGHRYTIVAYYGYPVAGYDKLKIHLSAAFPAGFHPHGATLSTADVHKTTETPLAVNGDRLDVDLDIPACSGVAVSAQ